MNRRMISKGLMVVFAALCLAPLQVLADDEKDNDDGDGDGKLSVTVSFGAGLNTAQPGNAANHHILPPVIKVRKGGVVNFVVAGFHQPMIYLPGVRHGDIVVPAGGLFINYTPNLFYRGIAPAGGPAGTPATANPANGSNRVESVSFPEAGDYFVLCNVRPHFLDGMFATVRVR